LGQIQSIDGIILATERICLRRFRPQDAPLLYDLDSDPEVMRFISKGAPTPLTQIETVILPRILSYYQKSPPEGCWAAFLASTCDFIGWFHLRADKVQPEEMELGYRLKRSAWGCGLATEGSRALLQAAFQEWHHDKVCARTLVSNRASQRVMQKIGLTFEGEFLYGLDILPGWSAEERRAVKYGIARSQWVKRERLPEH
jgi:RimJ/RimL family protein N-acetyltransferase